MSKVKGFILIPVLQKNTPGENSQFGELSQMSLTFSREQGIYTVSNDTLLHSFLSEDETGAKIAVPQAIQDAIGEVSQEILDLFIGDQMGSIADEDALKTYIEGVLTPGILDNLIFYDKIESVDVGQENYWMPGSAEFTVTAGGIEYNVRVWFTNNEFETQYDEWEIVVIPPVMSDVDELNTTPSAINNLVTTATNMTNMLPKINAAKGNKPPTMTASLNLTWNDPAGGSSTYITPWVFLAWGPYGGNASRVRPVIKKYIEDNSILLQEAWEIIYPELYETMEFYVIPYWDRISIPEMGPVSGIYSPVITDYTSITTRGNLFAAGLNPGQVTAGSALMPALYKSILNVTVGNPSNTGGVIHINSLYPDYSLIPTDHADFDRMTTETKDFIIKLNQCLAVAETATSSSPVPSGFTRETRAGKRYIAFSILGTDFLIPTKATVLEGI